MVTIRDSVVDIGASRLRANTHTRRCINIGRPERRHRRGRWIHEPRATTGERFSRRFYVRTCANGRRSEPGKSGIFIFSGESRGREDWPKTSSIRPRPNTIYLRASAKRRGKTVRVLPRNTTDRASIFFTANSSIDHRIVEQFIINCPTRYS